MARNTKQFTYLAVLSSFLQALKDRRQFCMRRFQVTTRCLWILADDEINTYIEGEKVQGRGLWRAGV